jgi:tripartite ATP-independent transporter DctM subunit
MSPEWIGGVAFLALLVLIFAGVPLGFALAGVGFVGVIAMSGWSAAMGVFSTAPFSIVSGYTYITVPLFVLMGILAFHSGVVADAFSAAYKWVGRAPGGLAMGTIGACTAFAACTGLSAMSVSLMTVTCLPEMEKRGYSQALATGTIASGTTLGILIPPSIPLIMYGILSGASIGSLFIAGIVPGIFLALAFIAVILGWAKLKPAAAPQPPKASWREKFASLKRVWTMILLMCLIMGGIWGGIFTPVEAGGIGALGALIIALIRRSISWKIFRDSLVDTAKMSGMIFVLLIGVMIFNYFFIMTRVPEALANGIVSLNIPPTAIVVVMMICWLIGGCFLDTFGLMMLTLPVFIPIAKELGIDLIWFGILHVICIEAGAISPPVGVNVFMMAGMAKHIPMYTIFRGIVPFLLAMLFVLGILIGFPDIVTFLPNLMR